MRPRIAEPPTGGELRRLAVHELVRDYPETLAVFRSRELSFRTFGAGTVGRLLEEPDAGDAGSLLSELRAALDWREAA